jgi:hypothetical protein
MKKPDFSYKNWMHGIAFFGCGLCAMEKLRRNKGLVFSANFIGK